MSKWAEIRCDFVDEVENKAYIDAWYTMDENEEGEIIAKVNTKTKHVLYIDEDAEFDEYAQEIIQSAIEEYCN